MKKILKLSAFFFISLLFLQSCNEDDLSETLSNYATFESTNYDFGIIIGEPSATRNVKVYASSTSSSDRVFNIVVDTDNSTADPAGYTVPATVTIPGGSNEGSFDVNVTESNIDTSLILKLEALDGWHLGEDISLNIRSLCPDGEHEVVVNIVFDDYSDESSWDIKDSSGTIVAQVTSYAPGTASDTQILCLPSGDYTFTINDSYGDGLSWPSNGTYSVSSGSSVLVSGCCDFGSQASHGFTLGN